MERHIDGQHPDTATLLDFLDDGCSGDDSHHIHQCIYCLNELEQIRETRSRLGQLPQLRAPAHLWSGIQASVEPPAKRYLNYRWLAMAASVFIVAGILLLPMQENNPQLQDQYISLLKESRQLESALAYLDRQPSVVSLGAAGRIAQYKDSIATIDVALNETVDDDSEQVFRSTLMKERILLMRKLLEQQAQPLIVSSAFQAF